MTEHPDDEMWGNSFRLQVLSRGLLALIAVLLIPIVCATGNHPGVVAAAAAFYLVAGLHFLPLITLPTLTGIVAGIALALLNTAPASCFLFAALTGLSVGLINQYEHAMEDDDWHGWS